MGHLYKRGKRGGCFIFTGRDLRGKDPISQTLHFPCCCYSKPVLGVQMVGSELNRTRWAQKEHEGSILRALRIISTPGRGYCNSKPVRIITNETTPLHNPRLRQLEIVDRFTLLCFVLFTLSHFIFQSFYHGLSSVGPNTIARLLPGMAFASLWSDTCFRCMIKRAAVTRFAVGSVITISRSLPSSLVYSSRRSGFSEASLHVILLLMTAKLSWKK